MASAKNEVASYSIGAANRLTPFSVFIIFLQVNSLDLPHW